MAKTYRVFVSRHYIDVCFFDVKAETSNKAQKVAEKAAYKLRADSRAVATDNRWHSEEPTPIPRLGSRGKKTPSKVALFLETKRGKAYRDIEL